MWVGRSATETVMFVGGSNGWAVSAMGVVCGTGPGTVVRPTSEGR